MEEQVKSIQEFLTSILGIFYNPVMTLIRIVLIIVLSVIIVKIGKKLIKKLFENQKKFRYRMNDKRLDTMSTLTISVFKYIVYIGAILVILSDILNLKSILAAAGVGGIAIGLGAQSLIKDTISGFFILLEDQFAVGDMITIDNMTGTVEHMELRVTRIKNYNGDVYIIPNGEIKRVTNHTRDNKLVTVDIPVAYSSNMERVNEIAEEICEKAKNEFTVFTEEPKVLGITELGKNNMNLRIVAKTLPNEQWEVERHMRKMIKEAFEKNSIEFYDKTSMIRPE